MGVFVNFGLMMIVALEYHTFIYTIFRKKLRKPFCWNLIWIGAIGLFSFCTALLGWQVSRILWMGLFFAAVSIYAVFQISFAEAIKLFLVTFPSVSILESVIEYFIEAVIDINDIEKMVLYTVCIIAGLWLYYALLGRRLDKNAFQMPGKIWLAMSGLMFLMVGMITFFVFISSEVLEHRGGNIGMVLVIFGGTAVFILSYLMLYYFNTKQKYQWQSDMMEKYNDQQREYFEQLLEKEQNTRKFRHDMISDLLLLQNFSRNGQQEELNQYLTEMLTDITAISKENYDVGNEIVNTIINSYFAPIKSTVDITVQGFVQDELNISKRDLCVIVSNLVKNAVEAAVLCPENTGRIVFEVRQGNLMFHIKVTNTVANRIHIEKGLPLTSKEDKSDHGFGIKNVMAVAGKYHGKYQYHIEDGCYVAEIYLPI